MFLRKALIIAVPIICLPSFARHALSENQMGYQSLSADKVAALADTDEAGHAFQYEAGHRFRFEAGRGSDLMSATWRFASADRSDDVSPGRIGQAAMDLGLGQLRRRFGS